MAKKVKKNKLKTHKGTVKVLNIRQSGSITTGILVLTIILVSIQLKQVERKEQVML